MGSTPTTVSQKVPANFWLGGALPAKLHKFSNMPRLIAPQSSINPFHVTARYHNKDPFRGDLECIWQILVDHLFLTHHFFGLKIHAFVLMPNHFHLLCSSVEEPLGKAFQYFMRETSKNMNKLAGTSNQNWGCRYYRCEILSYQHFVNTYKYIYQNPVRANLASRCEDWKFSSLRGLLGFEHTIIPLEGDALLFHSNGELHDKNIEWLNRRITEENRIAMKKALSRSCYKLPKYKNRTAHFLESGLL